MPAPLIALPERNHRYAYFRRASDLGGEDMPGFITTRGQVGLGRILAEDLGAAGESRARETCAGDHEDVRTCRAMPTLGERVNR